jgi:tripartite-type tricarboxylate transporter receptor subunit TctC
VDAQGSQRPFAESGPHTSRHNPAGWIDPGNKKPTQSPYPVRMREESRLDRTLWTIVLVLAVTIVVVSFARQPLLGGDSVASGFSPPLTLWLAGSQSGGQAEAVAQQAATCWESAGRPVTVGVLPGSSSEAVGDFLARVHRAPGDLLLVTSTTLSDIAHVNASAPLSPAGESAQRTVRLLAGAAPVALLASDRLTLSVRATSPVRSTAELLSLMHREATRPLLGVAEGTWLQGNLASLAQSADLHGQVPYSVFRSSREAVVSLDAGDVEAIEAPHSALRDELREHRLRELPWPTPRRATPRAWVAVVAPAGIDRNELATLRAQAQHLCTGPMWARMLRGDGMSSVAVSKPQLADFVRDDLGEATRLQTLATHIVRDY